MFRYYFSIAATICVAIVGAVGLAVVHPDPVSVATAPAAVCVVNAGENAGDILPTRPAAGHSRRPTYCPVGSTWTPTR